MMLQNMNEPLGVQKFPNVHEQHPQSIGKPNVYWQNASVILGGSQHK
jgi:hypothetical protein